MGTIFCMMTPTSPDRLRQDSRLLGRTLLNLATPRLLLRGGVIVLAIILWLAVCRWLLAFGATLRYDSLLTLGEQTVDLLRRINPYLWWAAAALVSLAAFFGLRAWLASDIAAGHARPVEAGVLGELAAGLSADSLNVLGWIWRDRGEPLTIGDLIATRREIRSGRVAKMYLAREQESALAQAGVAAAPAPGAAAPGHAARAPRAAAAARTPAAGSQPFRPEPQAGVEPHLGPLDGPPPAPGPGGRA